MSLNVSICTTDETLKPVINKFKRRQVKNTAALIMKIKKETMSIVLDEELEDVTLDEVGEQLPTNEPRFLLYSYVHNHSDKRISYPQVFIFVSLEGCKPELQMMYTGSVHQFSRDSNFAKFYQVRSTEELTEEWLLEKLSV